ncbi:hypothetical protein B0H13DRAFT_1469531, partial [Mycena leptocephala]
SYPILPTAYKPPACSIQVASGPIQKNTVYESLDEGVLAVFEAEEAKGHKWILNQVGRNKQTGEIRRHTLRCNRYREPKESHRMDIDPADHRQGKSGRTNCKAHVNLCAMAGGKWYISVVELDHNHEPHLPDGGAIQRPPTLAQCSAVGQFADSFSCKQLGEVLKSQFPPNTLDKRQSSNMRNQARREAHAEIDRFGGDVKAI